MSSEPSKRTILFHRDYRGFSGGHLNVWQYFNHVRHSPDHVPHISFSKETSWDENNPWLKLRDQALATRDAIRRADVRKSTCFEHDEQVFDWPSRQCSAVCALR